MGLNLPSNLALLILASLVALLSGCATVKYESKRISNHMPAPIKFSNANKEPQWVSAKGYAPISLQPGATQQQKVVMAMRASRLQAYQELAAIIYGQQLFGSSSVEDMVLNNDSFRTAVAGIVRGARVVKSYPVQSDTYATTLEVDLNRVQRAWVVSED